MTLHDEVMLAFQGHDEWLTTAQIRNRLRGGPGVKDDPLPTIQEVAKALRRCKNDGQLQRRGKLWAFTEGP